MRRRVGLLLVGLSFIFLAPQAHAGSFEDGFNSYIEHDYSASRRIWERLAASGDSVAAYYLGMIYHFGLGTAQDQSQAIKWYKVAATKGLVNAQYNLGLLFCPSGLCTQEMAAEAAFWFRKAASRGYAEAQYRLGLLYSQGLGVPKDGVEAGVWFSLAAVRGHPDAGDSQRSLAAGLKPEQLREVQVRVQGWKPSLE